MQPHPGNESTFDPFRSRLVVRDRSNIFHFENIGRLQHCRTMAGRQKAL
jgi:hypothetical protein